MSYADITFRDRNRLKRWLQYRRLHSAINLLPVQARPRSICDFGAGNGELCKLLAQRFPHARLICFEPAPALLEEARANLAGLRQVEFAGDAQALGGTQADAVFCLEVFEHLPPQPTQQALEIVRRLLAPDGYGVIGVPVEIGLPAAYKGVFRMSRRYGAFDARPANILRASLGFPPAVRPVAEISPGLHFHFEHLGFDHRVFRRVLAGELKLVRSRASPFAGLGVACMPELNFLVTHRD